MIIKCTRCGEKFEHFTRIHNTSTRKFCDQCDYEKRKVKCRNHYVPVSKRTMRGSKVASYPTDGLKRKSFQPATVVLERKPC